ncbi:right-handed parallel beta-helix repeat-containing protein [Luteolibacter marinus]|uniref:right-handed parallel beta-helix repeat-containing protein n=1 Tax=Luteolibacter marinus TaxID=2776705 RepID=UPI001867ACAE|nr:right-handed parallel beta-helix repeat-containing protein [Luteolibacter marinus]
MIRSRPLRHRLGLLPCVLLFLCGWCQAQNILRVRSTATGAANGTTWADAYVTVQDALAVAVLNDEIWVAEGTYYPDEGTGQTDGAVLSSFRMLPGVALYGGFSGSETQLSQRDPEAHPTVLSGDLNQDGIFNGNCFHVVDAAGLSNAIARLDGFIITGGNAVVAPHGRGGGLQCNGPGQLHLNDCRFIDNRAQAGGAISCANASPRISNCRFEGNVANLTGGALYLTSGSVPLVVNSSFAGNRSNADGGAVGTQGSGAEPIFEVCAFSGNLASSDGGALWVGDQSGPRMTNCSFQGNRSVGKGGAIHVEGSSSPDFRNCLAWGNDRVNPVTNPERTMTIDGSSPTFVGCLFEHVNLIPSGAGNLDGTLASLDPRFVAPLDPSLAPVVGADLRLIGGSPAINAGINAVAPAGTNVDLAGNPRVVGLIDIGAYEHQGILRVRPGGGGAMNGTSWGNAFASLQDALAAAVNGSEIWMQRGTYHPDEGALQVDDDRTESFRIGGVHAVYGGFVGTETLRTQRDPALNVTRLSGDIDQSGDLAGNSYHVVTSFEPGATLDGVTVSDGNADSTSPANRGAGLYVLGGSSPRVHGCVFRDNRAQFGAAMDIGGASSMLVTDSSFRDNTVTSNGGALYIYGAEAKPVFRNCVFTGSVAPINGGAVHLITACAPSFERCAFRGNWANNVGGAIFNSFNSRPVVSDSVFSGNATNNVGGAVFSSRTSDILIRGCTFQGNSATTNGGAIAADDTVTTLVNTVVWDNRAGGSGTGGNASLQETTGATTVATNCLLQNIDLTGTGSGNLDGTDPANDPLFVRPVDPANAPVDGGNLRVLSGSSLIDAGSGAAVTSELDLGGRPRVQDGDADGSAVVDLGAFEASSPIFVNAAATGADDGTEWEHAFVSLQDALAASSFGDEIWVATGTYFPDEGAGILDNNRSVAFNLQNGVRIYGGFAGGETRRAQRNLVRNPVVLSGAIVPGGGATTRSYQVLRAGSGAGPDSLLDGFTVVSGNANGIGALSNGAGLVIDGGSPVIRSCLFADHRSSVYGGAVDVTGSGSPVFEQCVMQGNLAQFGGGITLRGTGSPRFVNCTWQGNRGTFRGGAIYNGTALPNFINCLVWGNQEGDSTALPDASIDDAGVGANFSSCLIQNIDLLQSGGGLNGKGATNDPRFVTEVDPAFSPQLPGDLRLGEGSVAVDAGEPVADGEILDLGALPRVADGDLDAVVAIDLGAYERPVPIFVDAGAPAGGDGATWGTALDTLQEALAEAVDGSLVWVAEGTYHPDEGPGVVDGDRLASFVLPDGVSVFGGFEGSETATTQRNLGLLRSTLSGDIDQSGTAANNSRAVTTAVGNNARTVLDGFIVSGGEAELDGAGMRVLAGAVQQVRNCIFENNHAVNHGGAVQVEGGAVVFTNCAFSGNHGTYGGAVNVATGSTAEFTNCTLVGNRAIKDGGALRVNAGTLVLRNTVVWSNAAFGDIASATASLSNAGGTSVISYEHCLVDTLDLTASGSGNLDGTDALNAPRFIHAPDPLLAPSAGADLRLADVSPLLDAGSNAVGVPPFDLGGAARIFNSTIDIGAYEGLPFPEIEILDPVVGLLVDDGPVVDVGLLLQGSGNLLRILTVGNPSTATLGPLAVTPLTTFPGSIMITGQPPASLEPATSGLFRIRFPSSGPGVFQQTLVMASNDSDEDPFEITFAWIVASDQADADGDGLSDYTEYGDGDPDTDPFLYDTDGDGASDAAEIAFAAMGFDNGTDDSALLATVRENSSGLGLHTEESLRSLAVTGPVIARNPLTGNFELRLEVSGTPDLGMPFTAFPDYTLSRMPGASGFLLEFAPPDPEAYFFQIFLGEP